MDTLLDYKNLIIFTEDRFQVIFLELDEILAENDKLFVAVSGGTDSMFMSVLIYNYFLKKKHSLDNIVFIHCNHAVRKESDQEENFVKDFFHGFNLHVIRNTHINLEKDMTEQKFRKWRYAVFQNIIQKYKLEPSQVKVLLGHNFTDRIESTFMNMLRGCHLNGFVSMQFISDHPLLEYKVLRPLLDVSKMEIEEYCTKIDLDFMQDVSNFDPDFSLRNKLRLEILPYIYELSHKDDGFNNSFFGSMRNIYVELENQCNHSSYGGDFPPIKNISQSVYWNAKYAFERDILPSLVRETLFIRLLKKLNIYAGVNSKVIHEFIVFFAKNKNGYKYFKGAYFFVFNCKIYIISASENFWKKKIDKQIIIDKLGIYEIVHEKVDIQDQKCVTKILRYPQIGDMYGSKRRGKYCINQKIPLFWRNFIPIVSDGKQIIRYFYPRNIG